MIWTCAWIGTEGSIGCGRLRIVIEETVLVEDDMSFAKVYEYEGASGMFSWRYTSKEA